MMEAKKDERQQATNTQQAKNDFANKTRLKLGSKTYSSFPSRL